MTESYEVHSMLIPSQCYLSPSILGKLNRQCVETIQETPKLEIIIRIEYAVSKELDKK